MAYGDLSEDVLWEILLSLPVKSLVRFRCVSKSWYALLKSSYFINRHTQQCNHNNNKLAFLVTRYDHKTNPPISISLLQVLKNNNTNTIKDAVFVNTIEEVPSPATLKSLLLPLFTFRILGPVNGVFCVIYFQKKSCNDTADLENIRLHLCNPSLGETRILPDVPKVCGLIWTTSSFGFGYDSASINNDFKVVLYSYMKHGPPSVFIYTLNSDIWRKIDTSYINLPLSVANYSHFMRHHGRNGVIHWLVHNDYNSNILSFDLGTEVFSHTVIPYPPTQTKLMVHHIYNVDDNLIVILVPKNLSDVQWEKKTFYYEVWKMKHYSTGGGGGGKESWSKLHNIGFGYSMKFLKNEDIFFYTKNNERGIELVLYGPSRQQINHLAAGKIYFVNTYRESLVSLRRS